MSISKNLPGFVIRLIVLTGVLAGLSYFLTHLALFNLPLADVVTTYIYLLVLTLVSFAIVLIAGSKKYERAGFAFLGLALIKLMVTFAFLWPIISTDDEAVKPYLLHFFTLYFIYLGFEAWQVVKVIQTTDPNKGVTQYKDLDKGK